MKRFLTSIVAAVGLTGTTYAQQHFMIGSADVTAPAGWSEVKREEERLTLQSSDGSEYATVSIMRFCAEASFDDFKRLCQLRLEAEKKGAPDCFLQPTEPFELKGKFGMFYSGGEKKTGRVFSGYVSLVQRELVTIYVEGIGVEPRKHLETFQAFAEKLTRK